MSKLRFTPYEADRVPQILAFEKWDRAHRRARPFAGLSFFRKTSSPWRTLIASRHYPHLLCWQWLLEWAAYRADEKRRLVAFHRSPNTWDLHLLWIGRLHFKRQSYDRMAALGPRWADAPVIFPREIE